MGTIIDKLTYTKKAVDDIQAAIIEKGVECADSVPLNDYGDKIRDIKTHQKPTFCPWYDLGNVYYGFDENDIKYTTEFESIPFYESYNFNNVYYGLDENDIKYTTEFELINESQINVKKYTYIY